MGTGQAFVKWIKPAGCALFLGLFILVTVILFTAKGAPVKGYDPPQDSDYYSEHLPELAQELQENMFPLIEGAEGAGCRVEDGKVAVTAPEEAMTAVRSGVIHYYDAQLFVFEVIDKEGEVNT